jgi:adenosylcobinamide-GDP ribazoletransferase
LLGSDVVAAFMLLTRLPVGWLARSGERPDFGRCIWAFPIVGVAVNGAGGLVYWLAHTIHMPSLLAAAWSLTATLIITGAFHEDGLADTVDGLGGGATPARKLEIMRDSRIGSYGAVALFLSLIVRTAAIAALGLPRVVLTAMILAGMLGRSAMIVPLLILRPARGDGMGASVSEPRLISAGVGLGLAVITAFVFLPPLSGAGVVVLGFSSSWVLTIIADCQLGGHTGDVLGAVEVVVECVVVTLIASALGS